MRLIAAIVPPRHVLEELDSVVRSAGDDADRPAKSAVGRHVGHRRSLLDRLGTRGHRAASDKPANDQLDTVDVTRMHIPVTHFGNLTLGDSLNLVDMLRGEVASWSRPELRFAGGAALEWTRRRVRLGQARRRRREAGDHRPRHPAGGAEDSSCSSTVGSSVRGSPWARSPTGPRRRTSRLLVARLDRFSGRSWTQESVTLVKHIPHEPDHPYEVVEELPLGD